MAAVLLLLNAASVTGRISTDESVLRSYHYGLIGCRLRNVIVIGWLDGALYFYRAKVISPGEREEKTRDHFCFLEHNVLLLKTKVVLLVFL